MGVFSSAARLICVIQLNITADKPAMAHRASGATRRRSAPDARPEERFASGASAVGFSDNAATINGCALHKWEQAGYQDSQAGMRAGFGIATVSGYRTMEVGAITSAAPAASAG